MARGKTIEQNDTQISTGLNETEQHSAEKTQQINNIMQNDTLENNNYHGLFTSLLRELY